MELININCDIINCYIPTLVYCSAWWEDIGNPFAHNKKKKINVENVKLYIF